MWRNISIPKGKHQTHLKLPEKLESYHKRPLQGEEGEKMRFDSEVLRQIGSAMREVAGSELAKTLNLEGYGEEGLHKDITDCLSRSVAELETPQSVQNLED